MEYNSKIGREWRMLGFNEAMDKLTGRWCDFNGLLLRRECGYVLGMGLGSVGAEGEKWEM